MALLRQLEARATTAPMRTAAVPVVPRLLLAPLAGACIGSGGGASLPPPPPSLGRRRHFGRRSSSLARPPAAARGAALSSDPILVSAVSNRDTIASLIADRLARGVHDDEDGGGGEQDGAMVWATGAAAQFVAVGALAAAQPLLARLAPGRRVEVAARWAAGTDFEPDDQKRRLRKLELWARAVPFGGGEEGEGEGGAAATRAKTASAAAAPRRLSADRTRERDELVAEIARQLGADTAPARAASPPPSLAAVAAAALAPPPPAAAAKKRGRPRQTAEPAAAPAPAADPPAPAPFDGTGVAEIEARGEQSVMRAIKAVLFLQQQQQQQAGANGAGDDNGGNGNGNGSGGGAILVLAPRADMVADTAAERRGEPPREVPGIVLEVRTVGGGGGDGEEN